MIKTVLLTAGEETKVEISGGYNVGVINRTTDMLYASRKSGIVAGADDVAAIPAGDSYVIRAADDTVYLLATAAGDVQLESLGAKEVFKVAAARSSSGGGEGDTVDGVARQAIATHASHDEIHLTAEKAIEAAATAISNENLLINPNFKINQRGESGYTSAGYTVDGWKITSQNTSVTVADNGIYLTNGETTPTHAKSLVQYVENFSDYRGKDLTFSVSAETMPNTTCNIIISDGTGTKSAAIVDGKAQVTKQISDNATEIRVIVQLTSTSAGRVGLYNAKLELGSVATPFVTGNPATELAKCQRYLLRLTPNSQYRATSSPFEGFDFAVPTPTTMRNIATPTIIGEENLDVQDWTTMASISDFTYTVQALADNQLIIRATHADKPFTDAVLKVYNEAVLISTEL